MYVIVEMMKEGGKQDKIFTIDREDAPLTVCTSRLQDVKKGNSTFYCPIKRPKFPLFITR